MMLLFFDDDLPKRPHRFIVDAGKLLNLLLHVPKHDSLDSHCGGSNGATARDTRHTPENEAAEAAPEIASTAALTPPLQLVSKTRAMPPLVGKEMLKLRHHLRRSPAGKPPLRQIDAHGAMLARVIDLHDPVAEGFTGV